MNGLSMTSINSTPLRNALSVHRENDAKMLEDKRPKPKDWKIMRKLGEGQRRKIRPVGIRRREKWSPKAGFKKLVRDEGSQKWPLETRYNH